MIRSNNLARLVAARRTGYKIGMFAAAAMAVGVTPAGAQYGADPPLPPLPPLQGTPAASGDPTPGSTTGSSTAAPGSTTGSSTTPPAPTPASPADVADAVGSGDAVPAAGTAGEVRNTGVGGPSVRVVSSERAEPVSTRADNLPFTGARIGLLAAIGVGLFVLGLGVRRWSGLRAANP